MRIGRFFRSRPRFSLLSGRKLVERGLGYSQENRLNQMLGENDLFGDLVKLLVAGHIGGIVLSINLTGFEGQVDLGDGHGYRG